MDNKPNYNNEIISEISIELKSPQHGPETMRLILSPGMTEALIDYSGRLVPPGRPQPGQSNKDRKPYYHYKPGKKKISKSDFASITALLKKDTLWFAEKPKEISDSGIDFILSIKSHQKDNLKDIKATIVQDKFFKDGKSTKEFKNIFTEIVKLFNGEKGIFEPTRYD